MKKYYAIMVFAAGVMALTGCAAQNSGTSSAGAGSSPEAEVSDDRYNQTEIAPVDSDIALAFVTKEEPQPLTEPPQMMVTYSGGGLATAAAMTLGSSTWEVDGNITTTSVTGPVESAKEGLIRAVVDLDLVAENEPKIILSGGAVITGVQFYPLDGSDSTALEYTSDGVVSFPDGIADGVAEVSLSFEQGTAAYYFSVTHSMSGTEEPPSLMVYSGEIGFTMTRGGYSWTVTLDGESATVTTDMPSPWQLYTGGSVKPDLSCLPNEKMRISLPDGGSILSAKYYTAEDEQISLDYSGDTLTMPAEELSGVCCITVQMAQGSCDYLFSFTTGTEFSTAGFDPTA